MSKEDSTKRFSVTLPTRLNDEIVEAIPWGLKNSIVICLLLKLVDLMKAEGRNVYVDILSGEFDIVRKNKK